MTRVNGPDMDDYNKLSRVIKYLIGDPEISLTLEADNEHIMKWWVET